MDSWRSTWEVHELDDGDVVVIPSLDIGKHEWQSADCSCSPKIEVYGGRTLFTHNAFDKRHIDEWFEDAVKQARSEAWYIEYIEQRKAEERTKAWSNFVNELKKLENLAGLIVSWIVVMVLVEMIIKALGAE